MRRRVRDYKEYAEKEEEWLNTVLRVTRDTYDRNKLLNSIDELRAESRTARRLPGEGVLPLQNLLSAFP